MVKEAYSIEEKSGNTFWQHGIQKVMENVKIAFQTISKGEKPPNVFQYVHCQMVFDIKMEDFCKVAHLVAGGHMTHTPDIITYFSVVTR